MKAFSYCLLLLSSLTFSACQKDAPEPEREEAFVAGELLVGFWAGTSTNQVFQLANARNLPLVTLRGFIYTSTLPADSLAYIQKILRAKPYLNKTGFQAGEAYLHAVNGSITTAPTFFDMDLASQQDWLATIQQLRLVDDKGDFRSIQLQVPVGQEKFWRGELRKDALVRWAELNTIRTFRQW